MLFQITGAIKKYPAVTESCRDLLGAQALLLRPTGMCFRLVSATAAETTKNRVFAWIWSLDLVFRKSSDWQAMTIIGHLIWETVLENLKPPTLWLDRGPGSSMTPVSGHGRVSTSIHLQKERGQVGSGRGQGANVVR